MASSGSGFPSHQTLALTVAAAQRGEAGALDHVLTTLRPWGVRYFTKAVSAAHAEDLAQEFLRAIAATLARGVDGFQPVAASRFVQVVAWNLARQAHRTALRRPVEVSLEDADDMPAPGEPYEAAALHNETERVLAACETALSPLAQSVLMWGADGWTAEEIARHVGRSPDAVMQAKSRALRVLRRELGPRDNAPRGARSPTPPAPHQSVQATGGAA